MAPLKITFCKGDTSVVFTYASFDAADYTIVGDASKVSEAEILQMADMLAPAGWAA